MKKFVSTILILTMAASLAGVNTFATAPIDVEDECMHLNDMLEKSFWTNRDGMPVCDCKTCKVFITNYDYVPTAMKEMGFDKLAYDNIIKEYRFEIGKDVSKAVGETALSIALLNPEFLISKGLGNLAASISSKVGSKFFGIRIVAGVVSIFSAGAWYECKISADEARRIIKMTEGMLEQLSLYIDNGYWQGNNYLLMSYNKKDGTNAVLFGKNDNINYSNKQMNIHEQYFKQVSQDAKTLLKEINEIHEDYKKQLEMHRNNKWYKTFVTVGPKALLGTVLSVSAAGKLLNIFNSGKIPTPEEFNDIISNAGFEGEFSEKEKLSIIKNYNKSYKNLYKNGLKNPMEFIKTSINNLSQIQEYNRAAVVA